MGEDTNEDLGLLVCGAVLLVAGMRLWHTKVKPWLSGVIPSIRKDHGVDLGPLSMGSSDLVALGVLVVLTLVIVGLLRSMRRARRRES